jgi:hypothetical protein
VEGHHSDSCKEEEIIVYIQFLLLLVFLNMKIHDKVGFEGLKWKKIVSHGSSAGTKVMFYCWRIT